MQTLADLLCHVDLRGHRLDSPLVSLRVARCPQVHEELRDLVGVHAGRRYLDGARPVVVVVAESEGELLNGVLLELGVVESDVEVRRQNAPLVGELRNEEEVILHVRLLVLDEP